MNDTKTPIGSYLIGFAASLATTLAAVWLVETHVHSGHAAFPHEFLGPALLGLAVIQLVIQLVFFLHLGRGSGSRTKLAIFVSTIVIVLIIVVGAVWIMNHLNYNMMASPSDMNHYIQSQDGF